jgi:alcohol dehydrogenase class IV
VSRAAAALPIVVEEPGDLPARVEMLTAAALGGRCLQNATMGVHHGLAQLLGGRTGISHGLANAIVLPHAMAFNETAVPGDLDRIRDALGDVGELVARLGLPTRLSEVGVTDEDLDVVARLSQGSASVRANPRPVSEDDARMILEAAF